VSIRLADILSAALPDLRGLRLPRVLLNAIDAVVRCRTAAAGGHVKRCERKHIVGVWYNACRHRSCPRCAFTRVHRWLARQAEVLLGCAHYHIIFTVPHELNQLWPYNYAVLGDLLFAAARAALFELAADPAYLGARVGAIMALHSWGQLLFLHPHIHCLATAGGVDAMGRWVATRRKHFLPAEPLKKLFRGKYIDGVRALARAGRLRLPPGWGPAEVQRLLDPLQHKRWNVHIRERYSNPSGVLNYLGRYLNGGPIGEKRLLEFDGESVTFSYKDYRDEGPQGPRVKSARLSREDFVQRWLQHVPPKGFHMVRGYGLYSPGMKQGEHERIREMVGAVVPAPCAMASSTPEHTNPATADKVLSCPLCGCSRFTVEEWPRGLPLPPLAVPGAPPGTAVAA